MAAPQTSAHTRNDSGVSVHSIARQNESPSPTLTNPDMILPTQPWEREPSARGLHPLLETSLPAAHAQSYSPMSAEIGIATASIATRVTAPSPTTISPVTPTGPFNSGYEHGAPLSDIYEESEAATTPKSKPAHRSRSPSPTHGLEELLLTGKNGPRLRHKKRHSNMSSSSGGSDVGDWEDFDASKMLSGRAAADLAQMKREENLDVEDNTSRRNSREEEELAALNARAEQILENARKRLTHMGDNLKVARNSVLIPSRSSPHLGDHQQPVGGLYRSISAAATTKLTKSKPLYPPLKTNSSLQHMRGGSDTGVPSPSQRFSRATDVRSASALEYRSPARYNLLPDSNQSPNQRLQPSPGSIRSFNSPLKTLQEEQGSPSTTQTSPESVKPPVSPPHPTGLGIHSMAAKSTENLAETLERPTSRQAPMPSHLDRSSSSASIRSAKELKEQMSDLQSRIADLKSKTQADHLRRQSLQSLRTPSPFSNARPEQYYTTSPAYTGVAESPVNTNAGVGRLAESPMTTRNAKQASIDSGAGEGVSPVTPAHATFLGAEHLTPGGESRLLSSTRTDRNTPNLVRARPDGYESPTTEKDEDDAQSLTRPSEYEDAPGPPLDHGMEDEDDERIAENEEEQIYLNEVLEESLRDAEVEPEVPAIPGSFFESPTGLTAAAGLEAERHEDRLDAFDYENMFLHSAMGNYTGSNLNGSTSGSNSDGEDDDDDNESLETRRAGAQTPTNDPIDEVEDEDTAEPTTDEEMEGVIAEGKSPGFSLRGTPKSDRKKLQKQLPKPARPWYNNHRRNGSIDSVSTSATFETATEGDDEDEEPFAIYNWGSKNDHSPIANYAYSPRKTFGAQQGFSQGRNTPSAPSIMQDGRSPISPPQLQNQQSRSINTRSLGGTLSPSGVPLPQSPGLGIGAIGAENAQYINDNGVPERFQGQPSPTHSRNSSQQTQVTQQFRPGSTATQRHARQHSATGVPLPATPLTETSSTTSPSLSSSPQRKIVLNRSFRHPPPMQEPPDMPLPPPPPTSPAKATTRIRQLHSPAPITVNAALIPSAHDQLATAPPVAMPTPNTEILMESLIKLANPDFSLPPGARFAEVDKNLVLGLLSEVGSVCDSVLRVGTGRQINRQGMVDEYGTRLDRARRVLEGEMWVFEDGGEE